MFVAMDRRAAALVLGFLFLQTQAKATDEAKQNVTESNQQKRQLGDISNEYLNIYSQNQQSEDLYSQKPQFSIDPEYTAQSGIEKNDQTGIAPSKNLQKVYVVPAQSKSPYITMAPQVQVAPVQENTEEQHQGNNQQSQQNSYMYFNFSPQHKSLEQSFLPQQQLFFPEHNDQHQQNNIQLQSNVKYQRYQFVPYHYEHEHIPVDSQQLQDGRYKSYQDDQKPFLQLRLLPHYQYSPNQESSLSNHAEQNVNTYEQYAPQYNEHNKETAQILEKNELSKLHARAQAEAIAKSPPVVVHKEITITRRRPIDIIKAVPLHVPTPVIVPIYQPYKQYIPQPYAVPLEVIRPYFVPIEKTEKIEVEKPVPVEVEKIVQVPVEKKVYYKVAKPVTVEKTVPVEIRKEIPVEIPIYKPEKLTILRHIWEH